MTNHPQWEATLAHGPNDVQNHRAPSLEAALAWARFAELERHGPRAGDQLAAMENYFKIEFESGGLQLGMDYHYLVIEKVQL